MFDPYYITWPGFIVHLILIIPLGIFAWKHRNDSDDNF